MGNCLSSCNGNTTTVSNPETQCPLSPDLPKNPPLSTRRLQPDQQVVPAPEIPENSTQDKRVVVHETLRDETQSTDKPLKENRDVNLLEPVKAGQRREFCGKPVNGIETARQSGCRKIPVKRQSREENRMKPRPAQRGIEPAASRRLESTLSPRIEPATSRRSDSTRSPRIEPATSRRSETNESRQGSKRIPAKKQNLGELTAGASSMRSGSCSFRAAKGSGRECGDSQSVLRRTNSCRRLRLKEQVSAAQVIEEAHESKDENSLSFERVSAAQVIEEAHESKDENSLSFERVSAAQVIEEAHESKDENSLSFEIEQAVEEVEEKTKHACEVPAENASLSEVQCGSNLPPIDLENPLISLDCFVFL